MSNLQTFLQGVVGARAESKDQILEVLPQDVQQDILALMDGEERELSIDQLRAIAQGLGVELSLLQAYAERDGLEFERGIGAGLLETHAPAGPIYARLDSAILTAEEALARYQGNQVDAE